MCRGAPLSHLDRKAANVPLRDVAVLRCRTLIEESRKITGRAIWYEPVLADIIHSRRHEYGEAARNAGERGPRKVPEAFAKQKTRAP